MSYHTAICEQSLVSLTVTRWQKQVLKQMGLALAGHKRSPEQENCGNVAGWTI